MWNQLKFILERPKAIARPWWTLPKICLVILKGVNQSKFFITKIFIWINPWPQGSLQKSFKGIWRTLYIPTVVHDRFSRIFIQGDFKPLWDNLSSCGGQMAWAWLFIWICLNILCLNSLIGASLGRWCKYGLFKLKKKPSVSQICRLVKSRLEQIWWTKEDMKIWRLIENIYMTISFARLVKRVAITWKDPQIPISFIR